MAFADTEDKKQGGVLGDSLTLLAAVLYACYTIVLKRMMPSENERDMMAFFAFLGAINLALFGPVVFLMQVTGKFNVFALSSRVWGLVLIKGAPHHIRTVHDMQPKQVSSD